MNNLIAVFISKDPPEQHSLKHLLREVKIQRDWLCCGNNGYGI